MEVKPIRSEADHDRVLKEIERLWGAEEGTKQGDLLDVLMVLAEAYERQNHLIDSPTPVAAIRFRLDQEGLTTRALIGIIGDKDTVADVMREKRPLTLAMIRRLHETLGIPADVLIRRTGRGYRLPAA